MFVNDALFPNKVLYLFHQKKAMNNPNLLFCLFLLFFNWSSIKAQNEALIIDQTLITDYTTSPIYERITKVENGKRVWKNNFKYIDSIALYTITYYSDGLKVKGMMVLPKAQGPFPSIIYNRGGNRDFGALHIAQGLFFLGKLASKGYAVIASQYRGNLGGEGKEEFGGAEINDVLILTEVLKEVEKADADNIGMYGWSRGGMMTFQALTKTDKIKTAVVGGAVADHFTLIADRPGMETNVLGELVPNYELNKEKELTKRSAIKWVDRFPKNVPILLLHGSSDWRVKANQSLSLAQEFEKYRIPYRLIIFEGGDHGIKEHVEEVDEQVITWFDRFLKEKEELPNTKYHGR